MGRTDRHLRIVPGLERMAGRTRLHPFREASGLASNPKGSRAGGATSPCMGPRSDIGPGGPNPDAAIERPLRLSSSSGMEHKKNGEAFKDVEKS